MRWIRIDESGENSRSRLTKIDRKRLMNLVMGYAEKDNYKDRIESMLDGITA